MKKDYFLMLISELCHELGIQHKTLHNGVIYILTVNNEERIIWSKKFEMNSVISTRIADNKTSTYEVLKHNNIPCVEYKRHPCHYEYNRCCLDEETLHTIYHDIKKHHELVIKPENGYGGVDVYRCTSMEDLFKLIEKFQKPYRYICSSPYYNVKTEYRTICLNGQPLLSYQKVLPHITGNGSYTVIQLIEEKFQNNSDFPKEIPDHLKEYVPPAGEKINIGWKFNLSQGSTSDPIVDTNILSAIQKLSLKAAHAIHINFSSVDIIENFSGNLFIMEINSGVVLNQFINDRPENYGIAKNIYRKAILSMFSTS